MYMNKKNDKRLEMDRYWWVWVWDTYKIILFLYIILSLIPLFVYTFIHILMNVYTIEVITKKYYNNIGNTNWNMMNIFIFIVTSYSRSVVSNYLSERKNEYVYRENRQSLVISHIWYVIYNFADLHEVSCVFLNFTILVENNRIS